MSVSIVAEPRTEFGKGGARRVRRAGKLPAVLYGHGTDPRHISLVTREFEYALRNEGANVLLDQQMTALSVRTDATNIPSGFPVSISGLAIGASIHAGDVELPSGVELATDAEHVVVHILAAPTAEELEAELEGAEAELGAGPAAGGAEAVETPDSDTTEGKGEGDIVPDTASGEGGPSEPPAEAES